MWTIFPPAPPTATGYCASLRIFIRERPRVWVTSDSFEPLARRYAGRPACRNGPAWRTCPRSAMEALSKLGLPVVNRPPYDSFMLRFHHFLKESAEFQRLCHKDVWQFPPGSAWIVFTDTASHACLSGQYALSRRSSSAMRASRALRRRPFPFWRNWRVFR